MLKATVWALSQQAKEISNTTEKQVNLLWQRTTYSSEKLNI
jgi:hypothetical protein